jgi:hypothetical protein
MNMPLLDLLTTRKTLVLERPLLSMVGGYFGYHYQQLPPGISEDQAFAVIKETWGKKLAEGIARESGLKPGSEAWNTFVENWSNKVTSGMLKGVTVAPAPAAPTTRRRAPR